MKLTIDPALKAIAPRLKVAILRYRSSASIVSSPALNDEIELAIGAIAKSMSLADVETTEAVAPIRDAYRKLGKDPSRYRGSYEALARRIINGKGIYRVNPVVDLNNLISLLTSEPVGSYDYDTLVGEIEFRVGRQSERYSGIGKEDVNLESLPVLADHAGPFGSPTSDSRRSMITPNTAHVMMCILSFSGTCIEEKVATALSLICKHREVSQADVATTIS